MELRSPQDTLLFGERLASLLKPNTILALHGTLGAGKTTLVQGLANGLKIPEPIQSPTFTYLNIYQNGILPLFHFDLYRLKTPQDFIALGFDEYLAAGGIAAIEWPERTRLPKTTLSLTLNHSQNGRIVVVTSQENVLDWQAIWA